MGPFWEGHDERPVPHTVALVDALAAAGITLGCEAGRYCPADPVRRDEMASFLARAFGLAAAPSPFTDTAGTIQIGRA